MSFYLGLDASTQSLTATLIEVEGERRAAIDEWSLDYDELPGYGTDHGVLREPDPAVVAAPPRMWVDALDRVIGRVAAANLSSRYFLVEALVMTTSAAGTFWWPARLVVATLAIWSTTSMPVVTLPNTA